MSEHYTFNKDGESAVMIMGKKVEQGLTYPTDEELAGTKEILMGFGDVELINSLGVRDLLNFLKILRGMDVQISYEKCAPLVVKQMSMLPEFITNVKIKSVIGPFFCEECDIEATHEIVVEGKAYDEVVEETEGKKCAECSEDMEFDEPPESFFFFLME